MRSIRRDVIEDPSTSEKPRSGARAKALGNNFSCSSLARIPMCNSVGVVDGSVSLKFRPSFDVPKGSDALDESLFAGSKSPCIQLMHVVLWLRTRPTRLADIVGVDLQCAGMVCG